MRSKIYMKLGRMLKPDIRAGVGRKLTYAGIGTDPDTWVGLRVLLALLFAFMIALLPWALYKHFIDPTPDTTTQDEIVELMAASLLLFVAVFALISFLFYMHLYYVIDDRTKRVESILPDYLFIMSANLRAGMSPFNAFRLAALPHFGPLKEEVDNVASKAAAGGSLSKSLMELSRRVDSEMLRRTITFFEKGIRAGGRMAELLEVSAEEMRKVQELKREMQIQTKSYMVFIVFIIIFIIPLLLSISSQFLTIMVNMRSEQKYVFTEMDSRFLSILQGNLTIGPEFIDMLALFSLTSITLLVSIFIGVIGEGKFLYGIKYYPIVAVISLILYVAFRLVVSSILSTLA